MHWKIFISLNFVQFMNSQKLKTKMNQIAGLLLLVVLIQSHLVATEVPGGTAKSCEKQVISIYYFSIFKIWFEYLSV